MKTTKIGAFLLPDNTTNKNTMLAVGIDLITVIIGAKKLYKLSFSLTINPRTNAQAKEIINPINTVHTVELHLGLIITGLEILLGIFQNNSNLLIIMEYLQLKLQKLSEKTVLSTF